MQHSERSQKILATAPTTTGAAFQIFDTLAPVELAFMFGRWQGTELPTNHPMGGMLKASGWYGKEFINAETVHPLLMSDNQGKLTRIAPNPTAVSWALKLPSANTNLLKPLLPVMNSLLKTEESQARLRMMEYRGTVTATMLYDYLPMNDTFRKVDENTVLGVMDYKLLPQPFFFLLQRCVGTYSSGGTDFT